MLMLHRIYDLAAKLQDRFLGQPPPWSRAQETVSPIGATGREFADQLPSRRPEIVAAMDTCFFSESLCYSMEKELP